MGGIRSWLFRMIYPVPQKGDDLLMGKQKFTEEYISFHQAVTEVKELFVPKSKKKKLLYVKNKNDKEQKKRLEAYKTWKKITSQRGRSRG